MEEKPKAQGLNFRVDTEFAWKFKAAAQRARMKQNEYLRHRLELDQLLEKRFGYGHSNG